MCIWGSTFGGVWTSHERGDRSIVAVMLGRTTIIFNFAHNICNNLHTCNAVTHEWRIMASNALEPKCHHCRPTGSIDASHSDTTCARRMGLFRASMHLYVNIYITIFNNNEFITESLSLNRVYVCVRWLVCRHVALRQRFFFFFLSSRNACLIACAAYSHIQAKRKWNIME